jgi:hypothetical protein
MRLLPIACALVGAVLSLSAPATAQDYPNKDIHVVVGFLAGSGADVYARYFANKLSFGVFAGQPKVKAWRDALAERASVRRAVADDYKWRLWTFLDARKSYLSQLMAHTTSVPTLAPPHT